MIRRFFLRIRILVDLLTLLAALSFTAVAIGFAVAGEWGTAIPAGCLGGAFWFIVYRIVRTGSFMEPW